MTRLVQELARLGLVTSVPSSDDGRSVVIRATAKGEKLLQEGRSRRVRALTAMFDDLTAAERTTLERAVTILERTLATG